MKPMLITIFLAASIAIAGESLPQKAQDLHKTATQDYYIPFLINNVFNYYSNNGDGSYNRYSSDNEGFEFPKGGGKHTTFEDGILWGGYHKGRTTPTVGGSAYRHGLQAGRILTPGGPSIPPVADDPTRSQNRVYRVRPDVSPATPYDAAMQVQLDTSEVAYTSRYQNVTSRDVYEQYIRDWNEWPAAEGAPYEDRNGNNRYDPEVDMPGIPSAAQTLWYVANDLDMVRVNNVTGSPPIGIEMQRTIWGYATSGELGNTIFLMTRLINKSGAPIDSMFIMQWSDADIGDAGDDFAGCDTTLDLGYMYNGVDRDATYGLAVPAVGFVLLQGPHVQGTAADTAIVGWHPVPGYKNMRMSSYVIFSGGSPIYADPPSGTGGDIGWYRLMNGYIARTGEPFVDPVTGLPTKFILAGDPVTGQGWVDGQPFLSPQDRRMALSTGPFTMANGDTQDIVVAHCAAIGVSRISSVALLKATGARLQSLYRSIPDLYVPSPRVDVTYPSPSTATVSAKVMGQKGRAHTIHLTLKRSDGSIASQFSLFDDAMHNDGEASDGLFAASVTFPREVGGLTMDALVGETYDVVRAWPALVQHVTTAGPVYVEGPQLFSDNINNDGRANLGENVRYGLHVINGSSFSLSGLTVRSSDESRTITSLAQGATAGTDYDPADPQSYFDIWIPSTVTGSVFSSLVFVTDDRGNLWTDVISFHVSPLSFPWERIDLTRSQGSGEGNFSIAVVDPEQFKNHLYCIRGADSINAAGDGGYVLKDSTEKRTLLDNHPLPDDLGHTSPLVDGFKLLRGTVPLTPGRMSGYTTPHGGRTWTTAGGAEYLDLEGFAGRIGNAYDHWYASGAPYNRQHSVLIQFASTDTSGNFLNPSDTTISFGYRYLRNADSPAARPGFAPFIKRAGPGYTFQDYTRSVPFAAYDVDAHPPKRLMVGYLENNVLRGMVDGKYWPPDPTQDNGSETGPREWFFVFDMPYSETANQTLETDIYSSATPMMWFGYPGRKTGLAFSGTPPNDQFLIQIYHTPGPGDLWTFRLDHDTYLPQSYILSQNFPNPFNGGTTIRYTLSYQSHVTLKVYNILGQEIRLLSDGVENGGERSVRWDGLNNAGAPVASGVYFYRLAVGALRVAGESFTQVKKMVVLR